MFLINSGFKLIKVLNIPVVRVRSPLICISCLSDFSQYYVCRFSWVFLYSFWKVFLETFSDFLSVCRTFSGRKMPCKWGKVKVSNNKSIYKSLFVLFTLEFFNPANSVYFTPSIFSEIKIKTYQNLICCQFWLPITFLILFIWLFGYLYFK